MGYYYYYEIFTHNDEYVVELSFDDLFNCKSGHIKMYGLNVYYPSKDGNVKYPLVYENNIEFDKEFSPFGYSNTDIIGKTIINNIVNQNSYYNYDIDDAFCREIIYDGKKYHEESVIEKICIYQALYSITCNYDVNYDNDNSWVIRRNGQVVGTFDPHEYEKYYDPEYDGDDKNCYLGDAIIVDHISPDHYAINRIETNFLSYKLHNLGILWLIEHGYNPPKYVTSD